MRQQTKLGEILTTPFKCDDSKCPFGEAIRTLINEVEQNDSN